MDVTAILDPLNEAQREAVTATERHVLVLAGAGSGKTRVLVHRIAWCVATGQAHPLGILAVTFTNKAAREMRTRTEQLLAAPVGGMWLGTFHGIAHRLLRLHWQEAGLPRSFQILDSDDQQRLVKRVLRGLAIDETALAPREAQHYINARKEEGLRPTQVVVADRHGERLQRVYAGYEEACRRAGLVDFAELLLAAFELLKDRPGLASHYRQRFGHLLVDEFQDTNALQYGWLRLLAGDTGSLFVVGDDDQSIYSWRGADSAHMQGFGRDHPGARLVKLERNYRSTANILAAANALIAKNRARLGKALWTDGKAGVPVAVYRAFNDREEARYVVERCEGLHASGRRLEDCAVLYRTSAQSRLFEEALRYARVPYRVHGGFRFYERAEVKDVLAYLRLIASRDDDAAFERVVNTPARGLGERTLEALRARARHEACPLWSAAAALLREGALTARAALALRGFLLLVDGLAVNTEGLRLDAAMEEVVERTGLADHYRREAPDRADERLENLAELATAARDFELRSAPDDEGLSPLVAFLAHAALEAGEGQAGEDTDAVQLMTLHSAKGLEFPVVFLVGLEEGLFPHQRATDDLRGIEEERRLCYVGITRAREALTLTWAESRRLHGKEHYPTPSRFLNEIPRELLREVRADGRSGVPPAARMSSSAGPALHGGGRSAEDEAALRLGQRVLHQVFGEGVILNLEGQGAHARVHVNFARAGAKWLVSAYAGLVPLQ
jgi:DNA helicase-2/ATP-dependent DNA helicase PcrA